MFERYRSQPPDAGQRAPGAAWSPDYVRFRLRLVSGLLLVACLTLFAVCWNMHASGVERENAARIQSQTYAHAIAAHVADSSWPTTR